MISVPNMITIMKNMFSQMLIPVSKLNPQMRIMMPKTMPAIALPWGRPKHSFSLRLAARLASRLVMYKDAPQFTHTSASSSFLVPHLEQ